MSLQAWIAPFFGGPWIAEPTDLQIERAFFALLGGLIRAELGLNRIFQSDEEYFNLVGKKVVFRDPEDSNTWAGIITTVKVPSEEGTWSFSLDPMWNRIIVTSYYGNSTITADVSDTLSQEIYFRKEKKFFVTDKSQTQINDLANKLLERLKNPVLSLETAAPLSDKRKVYLDVTGLHLLYDWAYYDNMNVFGYTDTGIGGREIGEDDRPKLGFAFYGPSYILAKDFHKIRIRAWKTPKENPPTDNLIIKICGDYYMSPDENNPIATATIAASELTDIAQWIEKTLSSPVGIYLGQKLWIVISRSGSVDASKYFMVDTNIDNGYKDGLTYLYYTSGNIWKGAPQKGDLLFELARVQTIKSYIEDLLNGLGHIPQQNFDSSSIWNTQIEFNARGENTYFFELKELLKTASEFATFIVNGDGGAYFYTLQIDKPSDADYCYFTEEGKTRWRGRIFSRPKFDSYLFRKGSIRQVMVPSEIEYSNGEFRVSRWLSIENVYTFGGIAI